VRRDPVLTAEDVTAHSRQHIAGYKTPRRVFFVNELPRLPSGKVNKLALREQVEAGTLPG
jgi:Acyl-CoA synthetases (AMP-forming)/AMP-acid ligases II